MLLPRTTSSGSFQKRSPSRLVQMTSSRFTFIQVSAPTSLPLYVSPFFNSMSMAWPVAVDRRLSGSMFPPLCRLGVFYGAARRARWLAASASDVASSRHFLYANALLIEA